MPNARSRRQPPEDGAGGGAVSKALKVLRVLRDAKGPMTLTSLAASVGVAPSSAHSILGHLIRESMVVQTQDKRYELGPQVFYLGAGYARSASIYRSCWMELAAAAGELNVAAAIAIPWDDAFLVLNAQAAGRPDAAVPFGVRVPLDASAWAKVYYAWSGAELPVKLTRYTDATVVDPDEFAAEVAATSRMGYAFDRGEYQEGVGGVCAPVTSVSGYEGLASFVAPLSELPSERFELLAQTLTAITARASMALGDGGRIGFFGTI